MRTCASVGLIALFSCLPMALAPACSSDDEPFCGTLTGRYRECGLLGEGRYQGCVDVGDAAERCEVDCIKEASCEDLTAFLCGGPPFAVMLCFDQCTGQAPYRCSDGTRFPAYYRCDGVEHCADGSDEVSCPDGRVEFACRNTTDEVPFDRMCDGERDCPDGSDESICTSTETLTCDGGEQTISKSAVCDGFVTCQDGSDEDPGCARAECPNGG